MGAGASQRVLLTPCSCQFPPRLGKRPHCAQVPSSRRGPARRSLKRLKRDCPELPEKVIAGELSAHNAATEAGF
jgi:hypothetical protein